MKKISLTFLISIASVVCSRIECNWRYEFLCGDKCLRNELTCICGNDKFDLKQPDHYCCIEPNTTCKQTTEEKDVQCQGQVLSLDQTCHGSCRQHAKYGYTMLPCTDQNECYLGITACRGKSVCRE